MEKIDNIKKEIYLTRGDSMTLKFSAKNEEGEEYEMQEGDILKFAVKNSYDDENPLIVIESNDCYIDILPEHTENMDVKKYVFDVQLNLANGNVKTIIGRTKTLKPTFTLWEEVNRP